MICTKCKTEKLIKEFSKNRRNKSGYHSRCKACRAEDMRKYRATPEGKIKTLESTYKYQSTDRGANVAKQCRERYYSSIKGVESRKKYLSSDSGKKKTNERIKRYRNKNKHKESARRKVRYAIRTGKMSRDPCEVCGDPKSHAHHDDYSKPLNVRFLCQKHHYEVHKDG